MVSVIVMDDKTLTLIRRDVLLRCVNSSDMEVTKGSETVSEWLVEVDTAR